MNLEFGEYVARRCSEIIGENKEIKEMEKEGEDENLIRARSEEICYMRGYLDAIALLQKM